MKNGSKSPLKLVICPLVGRKENTLFAPLDPLYRFQVWPARLIPLATGVGLPSLPYAEEIGPALILASHIIISFTAEPPALLEVNKSYATSATIVPDVLCDHCQVVYLCHANQSEWGLCRMKRTLLTGMLLIALSCLLMPSFSCMLEKLLTPLPPVHVHVVFHEMVLPLKLMRLAHCDPEVAPDSPQRSRSRE